MQYNLIISKKWFELYNILINIKSCCLLLKAEQRLSPPAYNIKINPLKQEKYSIDSGYQKDVDRRDYLLALDEKRKADSRKAKIILKRIRELKAAPSTEKLSLISSIIRIYLIAPAQNNSAENEFIIEIAQALYNSDPNPDSSKPLLISRPPKPSYSPGYRLTPEDKQKLNKEKEEYRRLHRHNARKDYILKKDDLAWRRDYKDIFVVSEAFMFKAAEAKGSGGCFIISLFEIKRFIQEIKNPIYKDLPYDNKELI